jgi:hypothetical protein
MLLVANLSRYYSQQCDDVCFQQFQFEISTAIKAVKVHILFVKHNFPSQPRLYKCTCFTVLAVFITPFSRVSANIEMAGDKEQRTCIKFCFKLNKTAAETHRMVKEAFGEQALSQARTFEWFKRFKDGRESVEDDKHYGRPYSYFDMLTCMI